MRTLLLIAFACITHGAFSQHIPKNPNVTDAKKQRQGKWTLLYDANWSPVNSYDSAVMHRQIEYKNDKPIGIVRDYYANGKVQWEGTLLADRPKDIIHGKASWYREDGTREGIKEYRKNEVVREYVFNLDGSVPVEPYSELHGKALALSNKGNLKEAQVFFEKAMEQAERQFGEHDIRYTYAISYLGVNYHYQGKYMQAEAMYRKEEKLIEDINGRKNLSYAQVLNNLAGLYAQLNRLDEADSLHQIALTLREELAGKENADYLNSINNIASLCFYQGKFEKSRALFAESVVISGKVMGKNHPDYALALNNLGMVTDRLDQPREAEKLYTEALLVYAKIYGKEHPDYALALSNIATMYQGQGMFARSEAYDRESLAIKEKVYGKEHPGVGRMYTTLGTTKLLAGDYEEAVQLMRIGISIQEKANGKQSIDYADAIERLGHAYNRQDNFIKSEPLFLEVLSIYETVAGRESLGYAGSLNNLGLVYIAAGDMKKAEPYFQQALKIKERWLGNQSNQYGRTLANLAEIKEFEGNFKEANLMFRQALEIAENTYGKGHAETAYCLLLLGHNLFQLGAYAAAARYMNQAVEIAEKFYGPDHRLLANGYGHMAQLYYRQHAYQKARPYFEKMVRNQNNLIRYNFPAMSEKEREAFYKRVKKRFDLFSSYAVDQSLTDPDILGDLYTNQLNTKALLYSSSTKIRERIKMSGDTTMIRLYQDWQTQRDAVVQAYRLSESKRKNANISLPELEERVNELEKKLASQSQLFARQRDGKSYTWKDVRNKLRKNEAAVEIIRVSQYGVTRVVTDSSDVALPAYQVFGFSDSISYVALVLTPSSTNPQLVVLNSGRAEQRMINGYKNAMKFKLPDTVSYRNFWKPVDDVLKKNKIATVYVSPDGIYNSINLNTLYDPATNKYLNESLNVHVLTNTKDLVNMKRDAEKTIRSGAALFGYPDYSEEDGALVDEDDQRSLPDDKIVTENFKRFFDGGRITRLPWTRKEIDEISLLLKEKNVETNQYLERVATESKVKALQNPSILHIATHGFFLEDISQEDSKRVAGFDTKNLSENPLLRSGLLLAGAQKSFDGAKNASEEDGILTAYEAMNLTLDDTELVVLSACETGLGEIKNGEGVYGLQRAFQTAGANAVLMSLWKVDDNATQELMTAFYKNWLKSGDKYQAFKKAQAVVRKSHSHPYFWGAFVLVN